AERLVVVHEAWKFSWRGPVFVMLLVQRQGRTTIPIILRPCDWKNTPLIQLQALPEDGKPVIEWRPRDNAFLGIANGIRLAVEEMRTKDERKWRVDVVIPVGPMPEDKEKMKSVDGMKLLAPVPDPGNKRKTRPMLHKILECIRPIQAQIGHVHLLTV